MDKKTGETDKDIADDVWDNQTLKCSRCGGIVVERPRPTVAQCMACYKVWMVKDVSGSSDEAQRGAGEENAKDEDKDHVGSRLRPKPKHSKRRKKSFWEKLLGIG